MVWANTVQFPSGGRCVIAVSRVMCAVLDLIRRIAASQATILLIEGESCVGKDLVADEFHQLSDRNCQPPPSTAQQFRKLLSRRPRPVCWVYREMSYATG